MDGTHLKPAPHLRRLVNGYQISQAIHVAATLGIADLLKDGPRTCVDLAAATSTHAPSLYRLLRALASVGVFREEDDQRFALTSLGDCLRADHPESVAGWAAFIGQPYYWQAWAHLLHSVQTGGNAFQHMHGMRNWEYRASHSELSAVFDHAMTSNTRRITAEILEAYDFGRFECIVDVGGGRGAFLAAILARHPAVHGILFDQPHVVTGSESVLEAAGVTNRCAVEGGDFFTAVPTGQDAYVLKHVLHDWDDSAATAILRTCRQAMPSQATVLIIEHAIAPPNEGVDGKFSDLNMLVSPGGQERTQEEYAALFAAAGLRLIGTIPAGDHHVIEGVPTE